MASPPRLAFLLVVLLAGCDAGRHADRATPKTSAPVIQPPAVYAAPPGCAVTLPGSAGEPPFDKASLFGGGSSYGNAAMWVGGLWPGGVLAAEPAFVEPDGSVRVKLGWYRIVPGTLSISGRRLDAAAPPLRSQVPQGYGDSGFQSSGVAFPTEGCWEVTGKAGTGSPLTFVVYVLKLKG
jgi:hypothetical protein